MRKQGLMRKVAALLVVAMVVGLIQTAGLGAGKAKASVVDALAGLSWIAKPAVTNDPTEMFRTAAYGAGTIVAAGTPTMYFPVNDSDSNPNNDTDDLLDMHGGNFYETSETGASWNSVNAGIAHELRSLVYGPTGFVGVGYGQQIQYGQQSYHGKIMTSANGSNWSLTTPTEESGMQLFGITTNGTNKYVAVGAHSDINFNQTPVILTYNGTSWSSQSSAVSSGAMNAVTYGNSMYVAVGSSGAIQTSSDGGSWTQQSSGVTSTLRGVAYGNSKFVAVGSSGKILTSSNGSTWSVATPPVSGTFNSVAYGNGTFVIAGNGGVILSSQDGSSWTQQISGTTQVLYGAAYVNGEFMVLGANGTILMAQHKLNYTADANGTIAGNSVQGAKLGGSGTVVTPVGSTGYEFDSWSDGLFGSSGGVRTDSSISGDISAVASFKRIMLPLTYVTSGNGHIDGSSSQSVPYGDSGTAVTAVPDDNNHFVQWSDGNTSATRTDLNITASKTITAQFAIDTYNVAYTAGAGGTVSGTASQTVNVGTDGSQVTATPNTGYHFVEWDDDSTNPTRSESNVRENLSFTASFAIDTFTLKYRAGTGGSLTGGDADQTVEYGQAATAVTAVPATGYSFVEWSDHVTTATRSDLNVKNNIDVQALFSINKYTLSYPATTGGSVSGSATQMVDYGSNGTEVTAVADIGYQFVDWSDGNTNETRQDLGITSSKSFTANFAINTYHLTYSAGAHGTVDGTLQQIVNYGADGAEVTATPETGYHFVKWSDNNLSASRTDEEVEQDITVSASFAINQYTLDYETTTGGSLTGSAHQSVNYNADGTEVTAVAGTGYHFVSWSDEVLTATRQELDVAADKQVTAIFAIDSFVLTYTAGANGSITGTTPQTVEYGADGATVTAVPATGYHFVKWSDNVLRASRQDTDVTGAITVTAQFAIDTFNLNYTAGEGGSIDGEEAQVVERGADGSEVTAVPVTGYHFVDWSDGEDTASRTDTGVTADISVTANFAINEYTLTYTAGAHGSLTGDPEQTVTYLSDGSEVTAVPATNYHFVGWSDGEDTATRTDTDVTAGISVTANFAINEYTLTYAAGLNGTLTGDTDQKVTNGSNGEAVTAVPATGYHFVGWSDGEETATRTDIGVTADVSVTANFAINVYTLTYSAGPSGTLTGVTDQTVTYGSDGTTVVAVPAMGYHFVDWSDSEDTATRTDIGITADLSVTANFAINVYTLKYIAGTNGTLTGNADQTVTHGLNGTTVTAVPNAGYRFVSWSDGVTTAERTDLNISSDVTVTASFKHLTTNSTGGGDSTPQTEGAEVIIGGKPYTVGELHDSERDGQTVTTVTVDEGKVKELLASGGQAPTITIPVNTDADVAVGQLSGGMLQQLVAKEATLRIETEGAIYSLPTQLIDLEAMAKQFGTDVQASDLTVSIEIGKPTAAAAAAAQQAAENGDVSIIAPPVSFSVHFSYNGQSIELSSFPSYVERILSIPGMDTMQEATTAVIIEPDGTLRHVPTKLVQVDGKWYAVVNSLTNSMYAVVDKHVHFTDIMNHWAKDSIINMGSRTIVGGTGNELFEPNKAITRAEFAAIIVRALGLKLMDGTGGFTDVQPSAWYADAVQTAYANNLINGFEDGSFRPNASITREQAMTMIAKAMKITGIDVNLQAGDAEALLIRFADKASAGGWAVTGIAACLQSGIVSGQSAAALAPKADITRAEVAVIIERLLVKSSLI
ncbi:InlB B-repeat-containing protein [Paenibacillus sp. OV219]|uniref:InlB B-repeat-containing protein n=1 Tax=Paenibacillus sp. OV219 TaxID=1884377 RepID=UPI0008B0F6E7|nr:InlB B-repeat-containing protein [Paenibacillus sp. OV219]SEO31803.1 repeat domain (List_Bact_rpt) [Paenibacillus sp. OV219]